MQVGMGLKKVQKQGRDDNRRGLSSCRKVVIKKDWKTTLILHKAFWTCITTDMVVKRPFMLILINQLAYFCMVTLL